ncbi:MAG: hypothetical protein CMI08_15455 [Oceanospirillaceae bacterium]|uniref:hypothetical protein n=1 Tax=unclassified Thalassolituus TaxID=2624967 RepID=UPI000C690D59|nr:MULTISPECIES: hypothetical protein [unclassified Thalassolituus]MAY00565.1 hypothetical protein [Oceanospirillaceae bacterium]MBL36239.1 hypothetical protein [Oceanospirillaceae bacterium]MBS55140.1 hypothetical protein [Oceanospirillaceae bacterium]|tara:strand:- start:1220 stop:1978 length:759 start_codon:yes stop_codon:yes gene_type:complete
MAKKELTKEQQWYDEIIVESFRSEKKLHEYMESRPEEEWRKLESFSERARVVFGEVATEDGEFFENNKGQFIDADCQRLYGITLEQFVDQFNLPDDDSFPILIDYFESYLERPDKIGDLLSEAYDAIGIEKMKSKSDLKSLNSWVAKQIMNKRRPDFYSEEIYAYLIVIIGELLRKTKLKDTDWTVSRVDLRHSYKFRPVRHIYIPYLIGENGKIYDIVTSFRHHLFLSGGAKLLMSKVFNNVEEREERSIW